MKTLNLQEMERIEAGDWRQCALGVSGSALAGFLSSTGNGVAFTLGPIGVTFGALGAIAGGLVGAASFCFGGGY